MQVEHAGRAILVILPGQLGVDWGIPGRGGELVLDVFPELRPVLETVRARNEKLRIGQRKLVALALGVLAKAPPHLFAQLVPVRRAIQLEVILEPLYCARITGLVGFDQIPC